MRAPNPFARSLAFAFLAALAWPAFAVAVDPLVGSGLAISLYLVVCSAAYVAALARRRLDAAIAAFVTGAIAAAFAAVAPGPSAVALGAALAIGVGRSGLLHRTRPARALAIEALLLGAGLGVARLVAWPDVFGVSFGVWSFFLVQSVYAAIGGVTKRPSAPDGADRFDAAKRRMLALLEET
jgi:hypothetical protein